MSLQTQPLVATNIFGALAVAFTLVVTLARRAGLPAGIEAVQCVPDRGVDVD